MENSKISNYAREAAGFQIKLNVWKIEIGIRSFHVQYFVVVLFMLYIIYGEINNDMNICIYKDEIRSHLFTMIMF